MGEGGVARGEAEEGEARVEFEIGGAGGITFGTT